MKNNFILSGCMKYIIFLTVCFFTPNLNSQEIPVDCSSNLEKTLLEEWGKAPLSSEDLISWILIAEGANTSQEIQEFKNNLESMYQSLDKKVKPNNSVKNNGKEIFRYLHKNIFKKYVVNAKLCSTFKNQQYNCLTAATLFYAVCKYYNIPIFLYETPNHVFCAINDNGKHIRVELTDPKDGFDYKGNKKEIIKFLLRYKYITDDELKSRGEDAVYSEFIEHTDIFAPEKLLGMTYVNIGMISQSEGMVYKAIPYFEKAVFVDFNNEQYKELYRLVLVTLTSNISGTKKEYDKLLGIFQTSALLMKNDEEFIQNSSMPILKDIIDHYMLEKKDFPKCLEILDNAETFLPQSNAIAAILADYETTTYVNWGLEFVKIADFESAFEKIAEAYHQAPDYPQLKEKYISLGNLYALYEAKSGRLEKAMRLFEILYASFPQNPNLKDSYMGTAIAYGSDLVKTAKTEEVVEFMDSLLVKFPDSQKLKEDYSQLIVFSVSATGLYQDNPEETKILLLKAHNLDPSNNYVNRAIVSIHHSLAMDKVKELRFDEAKEIVIEGLKLVPEDRTLKEDLELINDHQNRP